MPPSVRALASFSISHRRLVFAGWLVLLLACIAAAGALGERFSTNFELPDSDSERALALLEERFPARAGDPVQVVFAAPEGLEEDGTRERVRDVLADFEGADAVVAVDVPSARAGTVSADGTIGLGTAQLAERSFEVDSEDVDELVAIAAAGSGDGLEVELGGDAIRNEQQGETGNAELVGLLAAMVVLLLTFGSVVAMGLPIITAVIALGVALSLVTVLTHLIDTADFAPAMAAMIGLGVGIDYALFVVTRYRTGLRAGIGVEQAVLVAMDTAGRAVLFAGATVCVALLGLFAIGVDFLYGPALAAALAVLVTMSAALTLLPALLSRIGTRIDRWRLPGIGGGRREEAELWTRWSRAIQRNPWPAAIGSTAVLVALAVPVLSIELGNADAGTDAEETTTRQAYDLLASGFGAGFNGPLLVVSDLVGGGEADAAAVEPLAAALGRDAGVAAVAEPRLDPEGSAALLTVFPTTGPQERETTELVERLREETIEPFERSSGIVTHLGGETAITVDFAAFITGKLPQFFGIVVLLSAVLLLLAFRSILVPLKAIVMNVLSIGAAFGVVVAIFQLGWGNELIGVSETTPIQAFLPVFVFAIVFGLSMDYEVFLMSRVHEEWLRRGEASAAVVHGLASTGRVITAAAAIMIAVFASFALGGSLVIKLFGVALAGAIAIDAFVIRSLLVPAVMELLGARAWWLPGWLDRRLPRLKIEAEEA